MARKPKTPPVTPNLVDISKPGSGFHVVVREWGERLYTYWRVLYVDPEGPAREVFGSGFGWQAIAVCAALNAARLSSPTEDP